MTLQTVALAVVAVVYFIIRYLNRTDTPKIKGLPEIPGVPLFGNLLQLGDQHATVAAKWAKKFGPVFQVRMGNKVRFGFLFYPGDPPTNFNLCFSALSSQIASTPCASSGSRTSPLSSPGPPSTLSTASSLVRKDSQSVHRPGMSPASAVARLQPLP